MSFIEGLFKYSGFKYLEEYYARRRELVVASTAAIVAQSITQRMEPIEMSRGLFWTTVVRDGLMEKAEKDALEGRTKRAYLEPLGGGLASIYGRVEIASSAGWFIDGRMALAGGIVGGLNGAVDLVQSFGRVSRIVNERRSAIPSPFTR